MNPESDSITIGGDNRDHGNDDDNCWTTIAIAQQKSQQSTQPPLPPPFFTRSTCSHIILNSPSSSCRLHVVNLNRQSNPQAFEPSLSTSAWSREPKSLVSSPAAESSSLSSHKSSEMRGNNLASINQPESPLAAQPTAPTISTNHRASNSSHSSHYFQSPTTATLLSKTSSRASSLSKTINPMFTNNDNSMIIPPPPKFSSIGWLKFAFKILLLFTVLFWLFSIVTWMSIMPKTMPISLTIITSMMTIGLIISLVIQSEWPYSFEFIPNVEDGLYDSDTADDSDDTMANNNNNSTDSDNPRTHHNRMEQYRKLNQDQISYKNILKQSTSKHGASKINRQQNKYREESTDSGLGNSQHGVQSNDITVIQIDD